MEQDDGCSVSPHLLLDFMAQKKTFFAINFTINNKKNDGNVILMWMTRNEIELV